MAAPFDQFAERIVRNSEYQAIIDAIMKRAKSKGQEAVALRCIEALLHKHVAAHKDRCGGNDVTPAVADVPLTANERTEYVALLHRDQDTRELSLKDGERLRHLFERATNENIVYARSLLSKA